MSIVPKPHESHEPSRYVVEAVHGLEIPYCMVQIQRDVGKRSTNPRLAVPI